MSYQKVKENNPIIAKNSQREQQNSILKNLDDVFLTYPKSFIKCPECYNTKLISCNCKYSNYACNVCDWKHINHHHSIIEDEDYRNDGNLFMKGAISKSVKNY